MAHVLRRSRRSQAVGLTALPDFATLEEVAQLPRTCRVAQVCATRGGVTCQARSLEAALA